MPLYDYRIAAGHNNTAGYTNVETLLSSHRAPRATRVPAGSVRRVTLAQTVQDNGAKNIQWVWDILSFDDLDTLVTTYLGDWDTSSAEVTIRTRQRDNTFDDFNAVMVLPLDGQDYESPTTTKVRNLRITFRNLVAIS